MRAAKRSLIVASVMLACVCTGWAQTNITLVADADSSIQEHAPDATRTDDSLYVRSLTGVRQCVGYARFDLRVLQDTPQTGGVFKVTVGDGSQTFAAGEVHVYGLLDTFGNTPQGWVESALTYNNTGLEVPGDGDTATQDIDTNRLAYIGDLPASTALLDTLSITNAALDAFITDRYANGGQATVLLFQEDGANRTIYFTAREDTSNVPPSLDVVGLLQALPADTTPPTVAGSDPLPGATGIDPFESVVTATFSELMDEGPTTNETVFFLVDDSSSTVTASVVYNPATLTLTLDPDGYLKAETVYTATVTTHNTDLAGNPLAATFSWTFTTAAPDTTAPMVVSVTPTNGEADVIYEISLTAAFDERMDPTSIHSDSFVLLDGASATVTAAVTYDSATFTATLDPNTDLEPGTTYTAVLPSGLSGVYDLATNSLAADYSWTFTTTPFDYYAPISLRPDADTYTRNGVNAGAAANLDVRGFGGGDFVAYIRFDLSAAGVESIADATLTLGETGASRDDVINNDRHQLYGLTDAAGNTPQNWDESADLDAGAEYDNVGGDGVDTSQVFVLDPEQGADVTETVPGGDDVDVTTTGPDLVTFLSERLAAGGQATFIVTIDSNNRGYGFASRENPDFAIRPRLALEGVRSPPIIDVALAAPSILVTWASLSNHFYAVERTANDLTVSDWVEVASNIAGSLTTGENTYTDTVPVEAYVSYRVVDEGTAEFFFDDFEGDDMGWTTVTGAGHNASTEWNVGAPSMVGPPAASSGTRCYGTNLDNYYYPNADIGLQSPQIDLTGTVGATLSFAHYHDTELDADLCEIYVRDASGAEIPGLESAIATYSDLMNLNYAWEADSIDLPAAALGQTIRIEFRFTSDGGFEFDGWYLDDVTVSG